MSKSTVKRTLNKEEKEVIKNKSRRKTENIMNKKKKVQKHFTEKRILSNTNTNGDEETLESSSHPYKMRSIYSITAAVKIYVSTTTKYQSI